MGNSRCLKFTQTYDPEYRLRYHAEVVLQNATKRGEIAYYGFSFKLSDDWQFDESFAKGDKMPPNRITIAQFISHFRDVDCGRNEKIAVPTTMVWIQNDELKMRLRSGSVCHEEDNNLVFRLGKIQPGKWHTLVFGVLWHKEKKGWLKAWYDDKLTIDEKGLKTTLDTDLRLFQFRVGMYPNWWTHSGKGHPFIKAGLDRTKVLYIDRLGSGPDLSHADPKDGNPSEGSIKQKIKYYSTYTSVMSKYDKDIDVSKEYDLLQSLNDQYANITSDGPPSTKNAKEDSQDDGKRKRKKHLSLKSILQRAEKILKFNV